MIGSEERDVIEESIFDAHFAATKFIDSGKHVHYKLLELSVSEALENLEIFKEELREDEFTDNYRLHLFVPLQLIKLMEMRKNEK